MSVWDDPRVVRGMRRQLEWLETRTDAGERLTGWKVAFGSEQAMRNLGIEAPLVGFLTDAARRETGTSYSLAGSTKCALEPEIAVHIGTDLPGGASREEAKGAIEALSTAYELADLDLPLDQLEEIVATDIFQRAYILGQPNPVRAGGDLTGVVGRVALNGAEIHVVDNPETAIGRDLVESVRDVANYLAAAGTGLRAGEVIITGSITPLLWVQPGEHYTYEATSLGELEVSFS